MKRNEKRFKNNFDVKQTILVIIKKICDYIKYNYILVNIVNIVNILVNIVNIVNKVNILNVVNI